MSAGDLLGRVVLHDVLFRNIQFVRKTQNKLIKTVQKETNRQTKKCQGCKCTNCQEDLVNDKHDEPDNHLQQRPNDDCQDSNSDETEQFFHFLKQRNDVRDHGLDLLLNRLDPRLVHVIVTVVDADAIRGCDNSHDFRFNTGLIETFDHNRDRSQVQAVEKAVSDDLRNDFRRGLILGRDDCVHDLYPLKFLLMGEPYSYERFVINYYLFNDEGGWRPPSLMP